MTESSPLLMFGEDAFQHAIAQFAGDHTLPTPVVFSSGWGDYTLISLLSVVGDEGLMPPAPHVQSIVMSTNHGRARTNQS